MSRVLAISASASATSKTALFVDHVLERLAGPCVECSHLKLRDLDAGALLGRRFDDAGMRDALADVALADAIVIATPIYKASYSGLLKSFLDLLPQFGLAGKAVLPLATGGSMAHVLALDYALRPVLQSMGARHIVQSFFLLEAQVDMSSGRFAIVPESAGPLEEAIHHLGVSMAIASRDALLGHPRPQRSLPLR